MFKREDVRKCVKFMDVCLSDPCISEMSDRNFIKLANVVDRRNLFWPQRGRFYGYIE